MPWLRRKRLSADLPPCWPQGVARVLLDTVNSTNAYAALLSPNVPTWILAAEQSGGRGRRGRPWLSPRGNFYATLALQPIETPDLVALRSFAAALALRDACIAVTGLTVGFALKWPNDVLLNGGKLAGILLESTGAGQRITQLSIGIGVNLIAAPNADEVEQGAVVPVSLLSETGIRVTPEAFLTALANAYEKWEAVYAAKGFAPLRSEWLLHAAKLGETITARIGDTSDVGVFQTIDETGALILQTLQGRRAIPAAEIFF
ncbi:BirA family transcriptional regulator, biotin operon repressor / biotin-[acetyl-CoA-carboxylase] ligase [Pseudorhodobacter antarcticus]|uniref:biotin--[biotin carboxyl-carrier protein] ligase n=1 Tax=Pseudorhodobacter antarcticus TaxID=1077947 RepID=A0A1H8GA51_9RHOB|nr:BirA family transcriptional regulator, biotin operon repressor / biotin-[acetyl-CoA-carboxylase] ligase [Pseudorhodobacter antarcticus]